MTSTSTREYSSLQGGGEMGLLTRQYNWTQTPLGPPDTWPLSLRTTLGILLHSAFPMFLFWGDELTCFYNDAYRPSLGNTGKHPAVGQPAKTVWPEVWDFICPIIEQVIATGKAVWYEDQLLPIFRNGQLEDVYWTFSYSPAYGDDGQIAGVFVTCTETTQEKNSINQLRQSEQRFQAAVGAVEGILWTNNAVGEMEGEQPGWASLTGQRYEDYQGYGWASAVHPDDTQPTLVAWEKAVVQRSTFVFEHRVRLKNGHYELFSIRAIPLLNPDGSIHEWVGVHTNVSKQRNAEAALRTSEARLRSLIANAPVAIGLFMGRDLVIDLPNQALIDAIGKGPDIAGKPLHQVMPELESQPFLQLLDDVFTSGQLFQSFESEIRVMQGGQLVSAYYNLTYTPLFNEVGEVYAILNIGVDVNEQVMTRRQVEQSEARFQNLIRQAEVGVVVLIGEDIRVEIVNDVYARLIDRSCEELLGKPLFSVVPEAEVTFRPLLDGVRNTGEPLYLNEIPYFFWADGVKKEGFLNPVYQPYREHDGAITGVIALCQDVTEQVLARRKIEESEKRFRSLIQDSPVATCLYVGPDAIIELANPAMVKLHGKGDAIIGKAFLEAMPEMIGQPFPELLADLYRTGNTYEGINTPADVLVDGVMNTYYFNFTYTPLRTVSGDVYAILGVTIDVTEQTLARQKIEEAEVALRGAIELAQLGSWAFEVDSNQFTYSNRVKNWFGFPGDSVAPDKAFVAVHEADRARVEAAINSALQPGTDGIYDVEYALNELHSGRELIMHAQGRTTFDAQGQPVKITGTIQDVTQDRRLQQELERQVAERTRQLQASVCDLERSNQNLQQFAYVASHDLQEPLRKIQSFGTLISTQYADQLGDGNDLVDRMKAAANRMSILIEDLLTFSRISTRQEATSPVSLTTVITNALLDLDLRIQETGAVVEVASLPTVQGDASQLVQLFQNLLSNALKFTRPTTRPHVRVSMQTMPADTLPSTVRPAREAALYHRIDVTDNGIGFDEKYADRIFQVFQRLHGRGQFAGTGIGLAICEKVVANHGGAIAIASQPGQGATFSVYLPA